MPELAAHRRLQLPEQAWDGTGLVGLEAAAGETRSGHRVTQDGGPGGLVVDGPGGRRRDGHQGHGEDHDGGATPMRHSAQDRRRPDHRSHATGSPGPGVTAGWPPAARATTHSEPPADAQRTDVPSGAQTHEP